MSQNISVLVGGRAAGRTTRLIEWVLDGEKAQGYPGWTRVMVVPTMRELDALRDIVHKRVGEHVPWGEIDFSHRFYAWAEWRNVGMVNPQTQVGIDDLDRILSPLRAGRVRMVTICDDGLEIERLA
jgi:hypothetical protein